MGVLGGVFELKSGLRILIWAPLVPFSVPPGTILDPGKVIFGHVIDFGHFAIEIEAEQFYGKWKEVSNSKNKNSFGISEQNGTTRRYVQVKKRKNSEFKNHPTLHQSNNLKPLRSRNPLSIQSVRSGVATWVFPLGKITGYASRRNILIVISFLAYEILP